MGELLTRIIRRLRPAPLASLVAQLSGMSRRTLVHTPRGIFWVNPVSGLGHTLITQGRYEEHMEGALAKYLYRGAVFVDLGANEGYFSVLASRLVGPSGIVIAVEPQSRLQAVIATNLGLNQCFNVRLVRAVVSSKTGSAQLSLAAEMNSGATSLFPSTKYPLKKEAVLAYSLADFLDQCGLDRCDLMKVDIEGAEYDVFMAAESTLKRGILRNIALEFHPSILKNRGLSQDELATFMVKCGYTDLGNSVYSWAQEVNPPGFQPTS